MIAKDRALKDIKKLEQIIEEFKKLNFHTKYPEILEWAENYCSDARHFYKDKDYFSAFGAANYAFGIIDGIMILEKRK